MCYGNMWHWCVGTPKVPIFYKLDHNVYRDNISLTSVYDPWLALLLFSGFTNYLLHVLYFIWNSSFLCQGYTLGSSLLSDGHSFIYWHMCFFKHSCFKILLLIFSKWCLLNISYRVNGQLFCFSVRCYLDQCQKRLTFFLNTKPMPTNKQTVWCIPPLYFVS